MTRERPNGPPNSRSNSVTNGKEQAPMTTSAIEVHGLRKSYGDKVVLDGVDLTVAAGTVTALLAERCRQDDHRAHPEHPRAA